jgi:hypothetical protein
MKVRSSLKSLKTRHRDCTLVRRKATDTVDGFRIDRGFQVYLEAYPEGRRQLDLAALRFGWFEPGALVVDGGRLREVSDPWRRPWAAVKSLLSGMVGVGDGLRTARLRSRLLADCRAGSLDPQLPGVAGERSTRERLAASGFSDAFIARFFAPFFGGVFLDRSLETDESQFRFIFSTFARGETVVPALGMGQIPAQIAASLPAERIRLRMPIAGYVRRGNGYLVRTAAGEELPFDAVVLATDMSSAHDLEGRIVERDWCSTSTFHWACPRGRLPAPLHEPILFLDGTGEGPVNHAACLSSVAPEYAPEGQSLVMLNMVDVDWSAESMSSVTARMVLQMERWFGTGAMTGWRLLRTDRILRALPRQHTQDLHGRHSTELDDGLFVAGDHVTDASIDGAVRSGTLAAEGVMRWNAVSR